MSKARALAFDLVARPLSDEERQRRRQAEGRRTGLVGDLSGRVLEPAPAPTQAPRPVGQGDETTID